MKRLAFLLLALAGISLGAVPPDTAKVEIKEWPVPYEKSRPRDPYVESSDRVWFCGQEGNYLGLLNPKTGDIKRYELDPMTGPHNLIVDKQGYVWYAGNLNAHIGKLDPKTGKIEKFPMPDPAARDPHTLVWDKNGDIWFTVQGGNFVGKLETVTGKVHLVKVPTERARPYGIKLNSKGEPWIVLFNSNKLATIDPTTMQMREIPLPRAETRPRRLEIDAKDNVYYVDYAKGRLGKYDPATGAVEEWPTPGGEASRPYGMALDAQQRIWFVETGSAPNKFIGFDPQTKRFFGTTDVPSGGGTIRHMYYYRPNDEIWFGTDTNTVGRAKVVSPTSD